MVNAGTRGNTYAVIGKLAASCQWALEGRPDKSVLEESTLYRRDNIRELIPYRMDEGK